MSNQEKNSKNQSPDVESIQEVLDKLPSEVPKKEVERVFGMFVAQYRGPIPLASELAKYENIHKGAALKILKYAEKEQQARHRNNADIINHQATDIRRSQYLAFVVLVTLIGSCVYCAIIGQPWVAGLLGVGAAISKVAEKFLDRGKDD